MYINLESDYAVRILIYLCRQEERKDANAIATATDVTRRFALKILRKLVAGGLVKSFKGISGGYVICKKPEEINLLQVIEIVEGRYYFSRCLTETHECDSWCNKPCCKVREVYSEITDTVREKLENVTFDQFV